MKCKGQIYTENTGLYLDRSEYDTPGSIRGCRCPDCERVRKIHNAASALGRLGGSVKSERKTTAVRKNAKKSKGAPWQNWIAGDEPENCIPIGQDAKEDHPGVGRVVRARSAEEACNKGIKAYNKAMTRVKR